VTAGVSLDGSGMICGSLHSIRPLRPASFSSVVSPLIQPAKSAIANRPMMALASNIIAFFAARLTGVIVSLV
jgi:hypothetical protein